MPGCQQPPCTCLTPSTRTKAVELPPSSAWHPTALTRWDLPCLLQPVAVMPGEHSGIFPCMYSLPSDHAVSRSLRLLLISHTQSSQHHQHAGWQCRLPAAPPVESGLWVHAEKGEFPRPGTEGGRLLLRELAVLALGALCGQREALQEFVPAPAPLPQCLFPHSV